jgi:hypothetical protein
VSGLSLLKIYKKLNAMGGGGDEIRACVLSGRAKSNEVKKRGRKIRVFYIRINPKNL